MIRKISKIKISNLELDLNVFAAPMLEVSDYPYRKISREFGAGLTFTEMASAAGIIENEYHALKLSTISPDEHPVAVQLLANDPDVIAEASQVLEDKGADLINLNAGCSVKLVCNLGFGAALLENLDLFSRIINKTKKSVKRIPISAKVRVGINENKINIKETVKCLEDAGVDLIIVHGRTRSTEYEFPANWDWIKMAKDIANVPIIANGDIFNEDDALKIIDTTNCDGVMIARGSMGNPFIFRRINEISNGSIPKKLEFQEIFDTLIKHSELVLRDKGEIKAIPAIRKLIMYYFMKYNFIDEIKTKIFTLNEFNSMKDYLLEKREFYLNKDINIYYDLTNFEKFKKRVNYWI